MTLPDSLNGWPVDWYDRWQERAALMEHHGGLPREDAEAEAEILVRAEAEAGEG